jgi:hypothetical protein
VYVYGEGPETIQRVKAVTARPGHGEFIGTHQEDDTEQRADAQTVYEGIIGGSGVPGSGAAWGRIRDRFRRPEAVLDFDPN